MKAQKELLDLIGNYLKLSGETISTAESVTSGLLQFSLSQLKDASDFFKGGITTYTIDEKVKFLDINQQEGEEFNCVTQNISDTMALNVSKMFGTDWGIAVTGYATPVEESDFKLFAYFSFSYKKKIIFNRIIHGDLNTDPMNVQLYYSEYIIKHLMEQMDKLNKIAK